MGGARSGRRPLPPALKLIRGTYRPDRDGPRLAAAAAAAPRLKIPAAPRHLSVRARRLWRETCKEWELDPAGLAILRVALEALDRLDEARALIERDGLLITTARGSTRPHPALRVEREARAGFLAAMGRLGLEVTP